MDDSIRTRSDMVRDLLEYIPVWKEEQVRCQRSCCWKWETRCQECNVLQGTYGSENFQKHKPGCRLEKLVAEAEAFIAEEELHGTP